MEDHNSNLECSLSKSLSTPKKCSYCQKTIFFKTYKCKHCRYKCHKTCAGGGSSRRNSAHKGQYAVGEEHWSKVLQASEVNSNLISLTSSSKHALHHMCRCDCSNRRGSCSSNISKKERNFFTSLYERFVDWVQNARRNAPRNGASSASRASSVSSAPRSRTSSRSSMDFSNSNLISFTTSGDFNGTFHASISSEDSDMGSYFLQSQVSQSSSWTFASNSTSPTGEWSPEGMLSYSRSSSHDSNANISNFRTSQATVSPLTLTHAYRNSQQSVRTRQLSATSYQIPNVSKSDDDSHSNHLICDTWPLGNKQRKHTEFEVKRDSVSDTDVDVESPVFIEDAERDRLSEEELREALGECSISFSDLELTECLRVGRHHTIHRGRWHGDVMVHTYSDKDDAEVTAFLKEVSRMSILRHENITLFMGACLHPPNLAVVISDLKGSSLYEKIHMLSEKMNMRSRVNIVRQVAQGMGYLHARGIVLKTLNSKNIYLELKVKICLEDHGMTERKYDRPGYGSLPRGRLSYMAPELLHSLQIAPPQIYHATQCVTSTDVYAFGSLMYELLSGHFAFEKCPSEALIWQVGHGRHPCVSHLRCNGTLKNIIHKCWRFQPEERPTFEDINSRLQENNALHKRHSSSEPENINRIGASQNNALMAP